MRGLLARFKTKADGSINGDSSPNLSPDIPRTEPRMATDLGDALTAYWRNGRWFGSDAIITWMINHGHLSEAAYALDHVMKVPGLKPKVMQRLKKCAKDLDAARHTAHALPVEEAPETT